MWHVYIIRSLKKKKWYYVGSTNCLERRIKEHNQGRVFSTKNYLPYELVYSINFKKGVDAHLYERKIKKCRIEKEKLIKEIEKKLF